MGWSVVVGSCNMCGKLTRLGRARYVERWKGSLVFRLYLVLIREKKWSGIKEMGMPGAGILHIECILHIAYWVQHFPQHHLSGSGIAQLEFYHCREPAWGDPPMTKVMRKEARHTQGRDRASGDPWKFSSIYPQNQSLPTLLLCALTSDFPGAVPYHHLALSDKELTYSCS